MVALLIYIEAKYKVDIEWGYLWAFVIDLSLLNMLNNYFDKA